jgi:hypothetical protein
MLALRLSPLKCLELKLEAGCHHALDRGDKKTDLILITCSSSPEK